jgi:hypothetical protein
LNLQTGCRLVINLELPWNPMRLEQRIGRVDRLGQTRVVHVINLFARGTAEADVLGRLRARLERARQGVGHVNDPLGTLNDQDLTNTILNADPFILPPFGELGVDESTAEGRPFDELRVDLSTAEGRQAQDDRPKIDPDSVWQPDLRDDAIIEVRRLRSMRRVASHTAPLDQADTLVTTIPATRFRDRLTLPALIWIVRAHLVDGSGQLLEQVLVSLVGAAPCSLGKEKPSILRASVAALLEAARPQLCAHALAIAAHRLQTIGDRHTQALDAARARELSLLHAIEAHDVGRIPFQAGLFDRRAVRDRDAALQQQARGLGDAAARVNQIDTAGAGAVATDPELLLVLLVGNRQPAR